MDIGKISGNDSFYAGYEGEPRITLSIKGMEEICIHLWDGYFEDVFGKPILDGCGWTGFTRDYNQLEGAFAPETDCKEIVPDEYLRDVFLYKDKVFDYEETAQVVELICDLLEYAAESGKNVIVTVE